MTITELIGLGYDLDQLKAEIKTMSEYDRKWITEINRVGETLEMLMEIKKKEEDN